MRPTARLLALPLLALAALAAPTAAEDALELRIVSLNAWGLPWADDRAGRIAALGPALTALEPDVVVLQEVWQAADVAALEAALAEAGLPHAAHADEGLFGSGLVIAARYPLGNVAFDAFSLAGKPHKPYHGDWYARKGVLGATLDTDLGPVRIAAAHLHARYGAAEYAPHQVTQALEAADWLGDLGARPPPDPFDPARPPLVLAGDLNAGRDDLPFRLLCARADLTPAADDMGIDWVLYRAGGGVRVRAAQVRTVLDADVDLPGGGRARLSDHAGRLAVLELERRRRRPPIAPDPRPRWAVAAADAIPFVAAELAASRARGRGALTRGVVAIVAAVLLMALGRKLEGKRIRGCAVGAAALALLHLGTWWVYVGGVYERGLQAALEGAAARLEETDR